MNFLVNLDVDDLEKAAQSRCLGARPLSICSLNHPGLRSRIQPCSAAVTSAIGRRSISIFCHYARWNNAAAGGAPLLLSHGVTQSWCYWTPIVEAIGAGREIFALVSEAAAIPAGCRMATALSTIRAINRLCCVRSCASRRC